MAGATGGRSRTRKGAGRGRRKLARRPKIGNEERRHLVEACAFFHADRFRPVEPGTIRAQDLKDAATEIDGVLKPSAGKGRKA